MFNKLIINIYQTFKNPYIIKGKITSKCSYLLLFFIILSTLQFITMFFVNI